MWCFGVKVLLGLIFLYILVWVPFGALSWLVCVSAGIDQINQSTAVHVVLLLIGVVWFPFAFGWMFHNARHWFDLGLGKDD